MAEYLYHRLTGNKALRHRREDWQECHACWMHYVLSQLGTDPPSDPPDAVVRAADQVSPASAGGGR